jgi:hypothetical protein
MITITIKGQTVGQIKQGLTIIERIDEELDSGLLIQVATTRKEQYPQFADVFITRDAETLHFVVSSDDSQIISKSPLLYQHTIMLIEPTKRLERQTGASITFTQPVGGVRYTMEDVLSRTKDVIPFETVINHASTRLFTIDEGLLDKAKQYKAPQFFISRPTALGALIQELKYLKAAPRLKNNTLSADFYNDLTDLINLNNITDFKQSQSIEYYATKLESYIDNQISESNVNQSTINYPTALSFASVRSDELRLTSANMMFKVPYSMYKIKNVTIRAKILYGSNETPFEIYSDLTPYIYESSAWASLPIGSADITAVLGTKRAALRYDYQGTKIYGFGETYGFFNTEVIITIFSKMIFDIFGTAYPVTIPNYEDILFNISYIPIFDTRIQIERASLIDVNIDSILYSNQQERIVDLGAFGDNLYGQINRLSNGDIEISKYVKTVGECFRKGQYTADNYIITVAKNQIYNDFIISSAVASRNYNKISDYVGINSEIRQYNIPSDGFTLERHERYSEYVELSDISEVNSSFVTFVGQSHFMQTFIRQSFVFPIGVTLFKPGNLLVTCNSVASGNSLIFTFGFNDNVNAGDQVVKQDTDNVNQYIRYANPDGTLDTFSFDLASAATPGDDIASQIIFAKNLPQVDPSYLQDVLISTPDFKLIKDPAEVLKMTYQLQIVTKKGLENTFVIGSEMLHKNRLVYYNTDYKDLKIYYSTEKYGLFENKKAKGISSSGEFFVATDPVCKIEMPIFSDPSGTIKSWAIGDINGNLFIACNDIGIRTVYINFKNKRG